MVEGIFCFGLFCEAAEQKRKTLANSRYLAKYFLFAMVLLQLTLPTE